jgi:conjugal transfer/entry exclusion protein
MFQNKKTSNSKALKVSSGLTPLYRKCHNAVNIVNTFTLAAVTILFLALTPVTAGAQGIITYDPVTAGIQAIIQHLTAVNTAIQAAESKIEVELSALKYARQGQQLMNQIQELQQESTQLIGAVNNIEGTVMMPYAELQGLKNTLTGEESSMQNIIAQEKQLGNPSMASFLQNYENEYGSGSYNFMNETPQQAAQGAYNQYNDANKQAATSAAYAQNVLDNANNNQHLISQLGSNVAAAKGQVAAEQANGQALVALTEEVNQLNKLEAEKAKLAAVQAGQKDSTQATQAANTENLKIFTVPKPPTLPAGHGFGTYPDVTNFK